MEGLRKQFGPAAEAAGGKLTMTAIALKIVAAALKRFPQFNASVDMSRHEIVYKKYYHVGVAVDTDRGLVVPVIRDVDRKNMIKLSTETFGDRRPGAGQETVPGRHAGEYLHNLEPGGGSAVPSSRRSSMPRMWPSWASRAAAWNRSTWTGRFSRVSCCR